MKAWFYLPAVLSVIFYGALAIGGSASAIPPEFVIRILLLFISAILLSKSHPWGAVFGIIPAANFIYTGFLQRSQLIKDVPIGVFLLIFYIICGIYVYRKKNRTRTHTS